MISHDPAQAAAPERWELQVQVTRTGPAAADSPARRWAATLTRAPETPADLCALLREAATDLDGDGWRDDSDDRPAPHSTLIRMAEDIAAADGLEDMRRVLRHLADPHAGDERAAVVYAALLGRAQSVLGPLATLARRLSGVR